MDLPPIFAEDQELAGRFRVELRDFARQQRGMGSAEAERTIEQTTEDLVRFAADTLSGSCAHSRGEVEHRPENPQAPRSLDRLVPRGASSRAARDGTRSTSWNGSAPVNGLRSAPSKPAGASDSGLSPSQEAVVAIIRM
jgi:hypothetical protein